MRRVIFAKYNQSRAVKYQTKTVLFDENGTIGVYKEALGAESYGHVESFPKKYELTKDLFPAIKFLPCQLHQGKVYYDYITGKTLDDAIVPYINNLDLLVDKIQGIIGQYYQLKEESFCQFEANDEYREIFNDVDCTGLVCTRPVNLDMIFDNVIMHEGRPVAYDYEWVYDMSLPVCYIVYRVISRIYDKYRSVIGSYIDFDDFVLKFGIKESEREICAKLEAALVQNIYGVADYNDLKKQISRERTDLGDLRKPNQEIIEEKLQLEEINNNLMEQNNALNNKINDMIFSRSWKMTKPVRDMSRIAREVKKNGLFYGMKKDRFDLFPPKAELERQRSEKFPEEHLISIVTPLFNTPESFLAELIESCISQTYGGWELCFVDFSDNEHQPMVEALVKKYQSKDSRILYERDAANKGIAENTNTCIKTAHGDYIAILDHDDVLHPSAFYEVMKAICDGADFVYTDEAKFEKSVMKTQAPYYKPDFTADQLRTQNFICHLNVYKKALLDEVGYYSSSYDGSQDHDVGLRLTEAAKKIVHIPMVLYFWRVHQASVASNIAAKPYATTSGIKAVNDQLKRMGEDLTVKSSYMNIPRYKVNPPADFPESIKLIVWGDESDEAINKTVASVQNDINRSIEATVFKVEDDEISCQELSRIVEESKEDYILFVRAGVTFETKRTISELMTYVRREGVAAAECKVVSNDQILNGGMTVSTLQSPIIRPYGQGLPAGHDGYEAMLHHLRAVSAVMGLCTLVSVKDFGRIKEGESRGVNPFIATSLHANDSGVELIWTPYSCVNFDAKDYIGRLNSYRYDEADIPKRDPYFNENILKYKL